MIDEFAARYVYFLAGYMLATGIFDIAEWVRGEQACRLAYLVLWAVVNGVIVFAPTGGIAWFDTLLQNCRSSR